MEQLFGVERKIIYKYKIDIRAFLVEGIGYITMKREMDISGIYDLYSFRKIDKREFINLVKNMLRKGYSLFNPNALVNAFLKENVDFFMMDISDKEIVCKIEDNIYI